MSRAIGYVRVSTSEQAESGYGLDVQKQRVADFCGAHGYELVGLFEDPGVRGALPLHERPGLSDALSAVRDRRDDPLPVAAVVVPRFDRIGRDALESLLAEREFGRLGAHVLYAEGMNGADAQTKFMRHVMHGIAELDKEMLVARLRAGRDAKRARGQYAGGRPRTGFRADGGELVPDPEAARVIHAIFVAIAKRRWSLRRVARELDERRALGAPWSAGKVHSIVRDQRFKRGQPPIVDPRIWNRANAALADRRPNTSRARPNSARMTKLANPDRAPGGHAPHPRSALHHPEGSSPRTSRDRTAADR